MARLIITGSNGFIGRHVVRHLVARGHEVHCVNRSYIDNDSAITCHRLNLLTQTDFLGGLMKEIQPHNLLHLAWSVEPGTFWNSRKNLDWIAATLNLYRAFVAAGGKRFVLAGTSAEYGWSEANTTGPMDEIISEKAPKTLYGKSKYTLFNILTSAASLDNISLASGRIFFLYGPHEKPGRLVRDAIVNLLQNKIMETTLGTQSYDFMHVDDVAAAFAALLDSPAIGAVNIASGVDQPLTEILQIIGNQIGRADLFQFGARPMSNDTPDRLAASVKRLNNEIQFKPRFDLESGLLDTINWWKKNLEQNL